MTGHPCSGCPVTAVNPEMLQRDDIVFREDWRNMTRQLYPSLSFSKGSVILDIRTCVQDGFAEGSQSNTKPRGKIFIRVFSTFWSCGRDLIPNYCSKWNLSPSFWSGDKRRGHGMAPSSMSIERKIQSNRQPARSWSLSCGLWRIYSCRRGN